MSSITINGPDVSNGDDLWPTDVGIIAIEVYFPYQYVDQKELEKFDGVSEGKYTIGLGQAKMGFCSDIEDINSICLTVVQRLLEKHGIPKTSIGRLEVGTETLIDKSKSVKSVLMTLFEEAGNTDVEGVDSTNACYGGTAALFNSLAWVESSSWDGRYALVVAGDIAVYETGNARPTGGGGAIAILLGNNAPVVFERGLRASHMKHAYDFYKPNLSSEYPVVDGKLSVQCYLNALDTCYQRYCRKADAKHSTEDARTTLDSFDALLFHSPYCKLVQKSVARLVLNDFLMCTSEKERSSRFPNMEQFNSVKREDSYDNREVEIAFMELSKPLFDQKTRPSILLANQVGNMYTPSLYGGFVSLLISAPLQQLYSKRVALFSYGSGLASSFFSLKITSGSTSQQSQALSKLLSSLSDVKARLESRNNVSPEGFSSILAIREKMHNKAPYQPSGSVEDLFPGTYYLVSIDEKHRRQYERKPLSEQPPTQNGAV